MWKGSETYNELLKTALSDNNSGVQAISAYKIQETEKVKVSLI